MVLTQLSKKQIILWRQGAWQKMQYMVIEQYPVCGMHFVPKRHINSLEFVLIFKF